MAVNPLSQRHTSSAHGRAFMMLLGVLTLALTALFYRAWLPGQMLFSNDTPLGLRMAEYQEVSSLFTGCWNDLNWLGLNFGAAPPNISFGSAAVLGPLATAKFYAPLTLGLLGICAWFSFKQ